MWIPEFPHYIFLNIQFSKQQLEDCKSTKKQERVVHTHGRKHSIEYVVEKTQTLLLLDGDFRSSTIHMFKEIDYKNFLRYDEQRLIK